MAHGEDTDPTTEFLKFLLKVTKGQRIAVLKSLNSRQCSIIRQTAYNILFNSSIELSPEDREFFKSNSVFIKQLASKNICLKNKRGILVGKTKLIERIARIALAYLVG